MPALSGFSNCPLRSRNDVYTATLALLNSLQRHQSPGGARIHIPTATGAHFDEVAAQLEGFARPLWAVGALLQGAENDVESLEILTAPFVQGLASGTDPAHLEYWGPLRGTDQRMVEMEIISFALLAAPDVLYKGQTPETKTNIVTWLRSINDYPLPINNWLWFRVMTNLALIKCCEIPQAELWPFIEKDFATLDSFYLGDGWSSDGPWGDERKQADYYSGSFAIQFSQLLYVRFASEIDPERCDVYRERARAFATDFMLYFNETGAAIPFGRSLTYRFAFAGFWAAAAYAAIELPDPLNQAGVVKGLLLRHLRWWSSKLDIFNVDGTLNIGYGYPNMYMCEDYNSPQSVYWCMKSLIVLALPASHKFWTEQESTLPAGRIPLSKAVRAPHQILCNSGSHHFLLSSGQFCSWPLKATEAKYGKFAYSSAFGFSVPTGPLIQQMAPDSTLALSADKGESWKVRWVPLSPRWGKAMLRQDGDTEELPILITAWKPWSMLDIMITTALIPPSTRWPDWHVRLHKVSTSTAVPTVSSLLAVEGGFAISGRKASDGRPIPITASTNSSVTAAPPSNGPLEAVLETPDGCCVFSEAGASGICLLDIAGASFSGLNDQQRLRGSLMKPDANTNLMQQRTVIPTLEGDVSVGQTGDSGEQVMAAAVFATTRTSADTLVNWADPPVVRIGQGQRSEVSAYIEFNDW